jgi:hypothetical protein
MRYLNAFGITSFVLVIAVLSVSGLVYAIQARANELLYYRELSKIRTIDAERELRLCAGPSNIICESGFECIVVETSKSGYGFCK